MKNKTNIYIVSKNRWDSRLTSKTLEWMGVPYLIIVEESQYDQYASVIDPKKILVLDPKFQRKYDTLDDLGDTKSKGPGPARNFAWWHSLKQGHGWHWVMDDNIQCFYRLNLNWKYKVKTRAIFNAIEDFAARYQNIGMAGPDYEFFVPRKVKHPPFILNTRIYSCNLIRNDLPFRWRGRYNEDTILSLDILTAGMCTIQFTAFLQKKITTQIMKGGNTAEFYAKEGTLAKSMMLVNEYPKYAKLVTKYGRDHHHVDYSYFSKNKLIKKPGIIIPDCVNNYGMVLRKLTDEKEME